MTFALDLKRFAEKAQERADAVVREVVAELAVSIDMLSPVGDPSYWASSPPPGYVGGHFRANWQFGIGVIPTGEVAGVDTSPQGVGGATVRGIVAQIPVEAAGQVYYLANNTPYSLRIEDGWSKQSPNGVVGITALKFQSIVDDVVGSLS